MITITKSEKRRPKMTMTILQQTQLSIKIT